MDILKRIDELRQERGWTVFELTNRTNLSEYTIYSWYTRGSRPTLYAIESVCEAFNITLGEFFTELRRDSLTPSQIRLLETFDDLNEEQQQLVLDIMRSYRKANANS